MRDIAIIMFMFAEVDEVGPTCCFILKFMSAVAEANKEATSLLHPEATATWPPFPTMSKCFCRLLMGSTVAARAAWLVDEGSSLMMIFSGCNLKANFMERYGIFEMRELMRIFLQKRGLVRSERT